MTIVTVKVEIPAAELQKMIVEYVMREYGIAASTEKVTFSLQAYSPDPRSLEGAYRLRAAIVDGYPPPKKSQK